MMKNKRKKKLLHVIFPPRLLADLFPPLHRPAAFAGSRTEAKKESRRANLRAEFSLRGTLAPADKLIFKNRNSSFLHSHAR